MAPVLKLVCQPNYQDGCALAGLIGQYSPGGIGSDRPSEKRKVGSSTLPLTTTTSTGIPAPERGFRCSVDRYGSILPGMPGCAAECRRVRGIPVGRARDADLWDFCGARRRPSPARQHGHSGTWDPGFRGQIRGCAGVVWSAASCCSRPFTVSMKVTFTVAMRRHGGNPAGRGAGRVGVAGVSWWWSVCRGLLGDGGAGRGCVGDGLAGGVGGEQGGDCQPVDGAGMPRAWPWMARTASSEN